MSQLNRFKNSKPLKRTCVSEPPINTASKRQRPLGLAAFLAPLIVYLFTLAPGAMWGDSAKYSLQTVAFEWRFAAGRHPLYNALASGWVRIFPFFNTALKLNILSALLGALAVWLLYRLLVELKINNRTALAAACAFAFSHIHWMMSVMAESYALTVTGFLLMLLLCCRMLTSWKEGESQERIPPCQTAGFFFGLVSGLWICNFLLMIPFFLVLLAALAMGLPYAKDQGLKARLLGVLPFMLLVVTGVLAGTALVWIPMTLQVADGKWTLQEGVRQMVDARFATTFFWQNPILALKHIVILIGMTIYQFPTLFLAFAVIGLVEMLKNRRLFGLALLIIAGGTYLFCSTYMIQRAMFVMLPAYAVWACLAGVGLDVFLKKSKRISNTRCMVLYILLVVPSFVIYPATVWALKSMEHSLLPARTVPYRDNLAYFLVPAKRWEKGPERFAHEAFETVPAGAALVADFTPKSVLDYYQKSMGLGQGVEVLFAERYLNRKQKVQALVAEYAAGSGLYFADNEKEGYPIRELPEGYVLKPTGVIFVVVNEIDLLQQPPMPPPIGKP